jgi:hypothetical protein
VTEFLQVTTDALWFRDPETDPPPRNTSLLLLNPGGVLIVGTWSDDCLGWCPKPKIPESIKKRMSEKRR